MAHCCLRGQLSRWHPLLQRTDTNIVWQMPACTLVPQDLAAAHATVRTDADARMDLTVVRHALPAASEHGFRSLRSKVMARLGDAGLPDEYVASFCR